MHRHHTAERNQDIARRAQAGDTYQSIADQYGISRQRVEQIVIALVGHQRRREGWHRHHYRRLAKAIYVAARAEMKRNRIPRHGSANEYQHYGCRCATCKEGNRQRNQSLRGRTPPRHGNSGYVNYGCRCDICKDANSAHQYHLRQLKWMRERA